jgi:hypothetical protein
VPSLADGDDRGRIGAATHGRPQVAYQSSPAARRLPHDAVRTIGEEGVARPIHVVAVERAVVRTITGRVVWGRRMVRETSDTHMSIIPPSQ